MAYIVGFLIGAAAVGVAAAVLIGYRGRSRRGPGDIEERVRRAEQLAYAGTLAGGLIHEIKNPLNTLSLNLQLLAEDWRDADTQEERRALKRIQLLQAETRRLTAILDDFLGFVRGHRLALADCDVNDLVEQVITFLRPDLESKRIEIRNSLGALPRCRLDAGLIKQALLNLLLNAEQALTQSDTREIILRTAAEGDGIRIDVIDTGRGIPPGDAAKIFEAFYSTRQGGTGLGLATTRRIVEEHGGRIVVHSDPGRGSCFTVTLPAGQPDAGHSGAFEGGPSHD